MLVGQQISTTNLKCGSVDGGKDLGVIVLDSVHNIQSGEREGCSGQHHYLGNAYKNNCEDK